MNSAENNKRTFMISATWSDSPVSSHFRALAAELSRRGHRVVILVDQQNHEVVNHDANPAVYTWPSRRPTGFRDALFLRKLIKQYRPHALIGAFGATNVMLIVGAWMRVPVRMAWYLTLADAIKIDGQLSRWKFKLLRWRKQQLYRLATHVLPNSAAGSDDAQEVFSVPARKCKVLYLSLPNPQHGLNGQPRDRDPHRAVCVGRLHPTKGQDVLLQSIGLLKDEFPQVTFEFVGDGPCLQQCRELAAELKIADRCDFAGRMPHEQVLERMGTAAVSVVPSRSECFGLVNIESLAMGTPVVASDVGGIGEVVQDGQQGYLVPPDDPQALADGLRRILGDVNLRIEMSEKALARFQDFEQSNVIGRQVDWLESQTASKSGIAT